MSGVRRTTVRSVRPWRRSSWPAANGMRCVKPSRETKLPSFTSAATASGNGWILPSFLTQSLPVRSSCAHLCATGTHYLTVLPRERVSGGPSDALDGERHALAHADAQCGQAAAQIPVLEPSQEAEHEPYARRAERM